MDDGGLLDPHMVQLWILFVDVEHGVWPTWIINSQVLPLLLRTPHAGRPIGSHRHRFLGFELIWYPPPDIVLLDRPNQPPKHSDVDG